jgi:tetratricopeptide (TPR) repeat protein
MSVAFTLGILGELYKGKKDFNTAYKYYGDALGIYRDIGDLRGEASILLSIGDTYIYDKYFNFALHYYDASLNIFRKLGYNIDEAFSLERIGNLNRRAGYYDHAVKNYQHAESIYKKIGDKSNLERVQLEIKKIKEEKMRAKKQK